MKNRLGSNDISGLVAPGMLLVATRALEQTPFARSVVLLLQQNDQGTFGVILNRPAGKELVAAWEQLSSSPPHVREHLACGGPLGGPVFAVHQCGSLGEMQVREDLFITASLEALGRLFDDPGHAYRLFVGMAGWKAGQLEREIESGCWYVLEGRSEDIIQNGDHLWERSLIRYGRRQLCDILHLPEIPGNPVWN